MAKNILYYGPPGTGKTYLLQSLMNDYIDYTIQDEKITNAYVKLSEPWLLITMILLQNQEKMTAVQIQNKIDSLNLTVSINASAKLDEHNIEPAPLSATIRSTPRIFKKVENNFWYVDLIKVHEFMPKFSSEFLDDVQITKRYKFVTFHQSYSYEDFIEGIRPEYVQANNSIDYSPKSGVFKLLCQEASLHSEKEYAIFIDEINRGNISEIFGELISLIEVDKRSGEQGELSVTLPYSKEIFEVPSNVNIYGTMNTADRSINQIDIALRRRFKFIPLLSDSNVIKKELELKNIDANNIEGVDLIQLFEKINTRIELLLDSQYLLGHAMFLKVKNLEDISNLIKNSVIPLFEEYFYDDLQKIQLIFNDLDDDGELKSTAIYKHEMIKVNDNFSYLDTDYMLDDKKHFMASNTISVDSLKQIYE